MLAAREAAGTADMSGQTLAWLFTAALILSAAVPVFAVLSNSGHGGSAWCWRCTDRPAVKAGGLCERCLREFQERGWASLSEERPE